MKIGKLENSVLQEIVFKNIKYKRPEVKERSGIGKDCAVIDFGAYDCVISTDPITAAINEIGRIAISITCNDIATKGIQPIGIMLAVMLPEGTTEEEISFIMKQAGDEAARLEVEIIGGHTEITNAVIKPVIVSTAIGRAKSQSSNMENPAKAGDAIIMTKYAGLEGTGIIASDFEEKLKTFLTEAEMQEAKNTLKDLSVVKEGIIAGELGAISMHDITEGGVLGAVWEICQNTELGCEIQNDLIPVLESTKKICAHFDIDYLKLISSGSMLIVADEQNGKAILERFKMENIKAIQIGKLTEKGKISADNKNHNNDNCFIIKNGQKLEIMPPESDHIYLINKN
jgi:hydrogenase expression/formation protein HypE